MFCYQPFLKLLFTDGSAIIAKSFKRFLVQKCYFGCNEEVLFGFFINKYIQQNCLAQNNIFLLSMGTFESGVMQLKILTSTFDSCCLNFLVPFIQRTKSPHVLVCECGRTARDGEGVGALAREEVRKGERESRE